MIKLSHVLNLTMSFLLFRVQKWSTTGENLSSLMFALYLNDIETFILSAGIEPVNLEYQNDDIIHYLKLLIFLYADDTFIFFKQ